MRAVVWLVLVAGCRQIFGIDPPRLEDAALGDDGRRGSSDGSGSNVDAFAGFCYGPVGFTLCYPQAPTGSVTMSGTLDTKTAAQCSAAPATWTAAGQPDVCVIAAGDIMVESDVVVTGSLPLVLVAANTIVIAATLDVSSHGTQTRGAGGGSPQCTGMDGANGNATLGEAAGGGAGGTFETPGGNGGIANSQSAVACPAQVAHTPLRGGMDGGTGGAYQGGVTTSGFGGGAVFLAAGASITVNGVIDASGGGGDGGTNSAGGAGGGAGGMIAVYAPVISANGTLMANGGGGGTAGVSPDSSDGSDPLIGSPTLGGSGGVSSGNASGGNGCGHSLATAGAHGGGAGGGGCGYVLSNMAVSGIVSPGITAF
jgi:hypothetical protein